MDGHGHLGRLPGFENAEGATAFSDTEYDEPTAPRGYKGPGIGARGAGHGNGCRGGFTAGGHGDGGIRARPGDENDGDDEGPSKPRGFHRRRTRRFAPGKRER